MKIARLLCCSLAPAAFFLASPAHPQAAKPAISLDEYFNATEIHNARISPDGTSVVIPTVTSDWQHNRYREDLWLWREKNGAATLLTQTGHDSDAEWSPDGKYIAFLSDRALPGDEDSADAKHEDEDDGTSRVWLIDPNGGEAFPLYREKAEVHSFAWAPNSSSIYFSIKEPLSKERRDALKSEWKDVIRWREQERGDVLLRSTVADAISARAASPNAGEKPADPAATAVVFPKGAVVVGHSDYEVEQIAPAPTGTLVAFETRPISHRLESMSAYEIYLVGGDSQAPRRLTNNEAIESNLQWSPDAKRLYFHVAAAGGSLDGKYHDVQGRLYQIDPASGAVERLGGDFHGSWEGFTLGADGGMIGAGEEGTLVQLYRVDGKAAKILSGVSGTYSELNSSAHGKQLLFRHSTIADPTELYLAEDADHLATAKAVTNFNVLFTQRATSQWQTYKWKADDGTAVEGVLIYPPGKFGAKNLPMLTLIHGGPADADGNRFGADWYDWATLAAVHGWLVFRPNYRGSSGYGDEFMAQISPHLVSRPGKDILEGVDALVKEGIADPQRLTIGGYSYGGYMTNWLITQTTRFKAAVTGAGAVEHAANWGNDDLTFDDAWYLSGTPWEKPELYQSEAALFQFNKVKTPTHLVAGNADVRVSYLEGVLMERALENLNIPHAFLVFPGEGHPLAKNPWHGYIKVREELKWLEKYGGQ